MKAACDYHPTKAAHFICHECGKSFCSECIEQRNFQRYGQATTAYYCPQCNVPASQLGMGNLLPPFWKRLPGFFLYPFHLQPLLFVAALATVAAFFPNSSLIKFVLWVALIKYSYAVLVNTAHGNLGPPKDLAGILSGDINVVFKQIGIFVVLFLVFAWVASNLGAFMGVLFICFAILSIPAMIMSLAATDSLIHALNPMVFVRIMFRIGWPYLLMYLFLLMMTGGPAALAPYLAAVLPSFAHFFLFTFAKQYYTIMTYNLMGYVLLQYHEEIGYEVDYEEVKKHAVSAAASGSGKVANGETRILAEADRLIKEGRNEEAISHIKHDTGGHITDLQLAQRFYNLLKLGKHTPDLLKHCRGYIPLLVAKSRFTEAYRIYNECLAVNPQFKPDPKIMLKMTDWLARSGDAKMAMNMAVKFIKADPVHALIPDAYFLLARILHERLNNNAKAQEILQAIIKRFPEHDLADKARLYLQQLT